MKVFLIRHKIDRCLADRLAQDGYDDIVYLDDGIGIRENIRALCTCDALAVNGSTPYMSALKQVADVCGIAEIDLDGYVSANSIISAVKAYFRLTDSELLSRCRKADLVMPRMIIALMLSERHYSYDQIHEMLCVDRATVYYYIKRAKELMVNEKRFRLAYESISVDNY